MPTSFRLLEHYATGPRVVSKDAAPLVLAAPRRELFVHEYVEDLNATQACIRERRYQRSLDCFFLLPMPRFGGSKELRRPRAAVAAIL